jgi:NhaP-type Na+/H+ or K+/H+ antiporter
LVLGLLVIDSGEIQHEDVIAQAVVVTVTLSMVLHSVTARPAIQWLSARGPAVAPHSAGD